MSDNEHMKNSNSGKPGQLAQDSDYPGIRALGKAIIDTSAESIRDIADGLTDISQQEVINDGVTHINIDDSGKTRLGQLLNVMADVPFTHPIYGPFRTVEGFWRWLCAENRQEHDQLRSLAGLPAHQYGKTKTVQLKISNFKQEIVMACYYKVTQNPELEKLLMESNLPFKYYYLYGPKKILVNSTHCNWLLQGLRHIREYLQGDRKKEFEPKKSKK